MSGFPSILPCLAFAFALFSLAGCTQSAKGGSGPMDFIGSRISVQSFEIIDVEASVLNPIEGATQAYADCVAAQYSTNQRTPFISRITTKIAGFGDVVTEKTSYLLSAVAPGGKFVLNASEIVAKCKANGVPTV